MRALQSHQNSSDSLRENAEILAAIQETLHGNTGAFQTVVARFTPLLYSLSLRMLGQREDAEEAVQEIFLRVYTALRSFRIEKRFLPWIYTIALNFIRTFSRRKKRRREVEIAYPGENFLDHVQDPSGLDLDRRIMLEQAEAAAARALLKIRHEHRAAFILRVIEGRPLAEIAEIMGIPEGTVKTYLHRAKESLVKVVFRETGETGCASESIG